MSNSKTVLEPSMSSIGIDKMSSTRLLEVPQSLKLRCVYDSNYYSWKCNVAMNAEIEKIDK